MTDPARRAFLGSVSKAASLTVAFGLAPLTPLTAQTASGQKLPGSLNANRMLDGWLRIDPDGTVSCSPARWNLGKGF